MVFSWETHGLLPVIVGSLHTKSQNVNTGEGSHYVNGNKIVYFFPFFKIIILGPIKVPDTVMCFTRLTSFRLHNTLVQ